MKEEKFIAFLEALRTNENARMIDTILEGFQALHESPFGYRPDSPEDFRAKGRDFAGAINRLQRKAAQFGEDALISAADKALGLFKQGDLKSALKLLKGAVAVAANPDAFLNFIDQAEKSTSPAFA